MVNIRIIEIPKMKAVYSGPLTDAERFTAFNKWFSEYHTCIISLVLFLFAVNIGRVIMGNRLLTITDYFSFFTIIIS